MRLIFPLVTAVLLTGGAFLGLSLAAEYGMLPKMNSSDAEVVCYNNFSPCLIVNRTRHGIFDYTITTEIHRQPASDESLLVQFDPDTSVDVEWQSATSVFIEYEGGDYAKVGNIPNGISVRLRRIDGGTAGETLLSPTTP